MTSGQIIRILVRWTPSDVAMIANRSYAGKNFTSLIRPREPMSGTVMSSTMKTMR